MKDSFPICAHGYLQREQLLKMILRFQHRSTRGHLIALQNCNEDLFTNGPGEAFDKSLQYRCMYGVSDAMREP